MKKFWKIFSKATTPVIAEYDDYTLKVLKALRKKFLIAISNGYVPFLCHEVDKLERIGLIKSGSIKIFKTYLFYNMPNNEYSNLNKAYFKDVELFIESTPPMFENKKERLNWLNEHIKKLENERF